MFSEKKTNRTTTGVTSQQNTIAKGTVIIGDIISEGDFRIEGRIEGNFKTPGKVVIGKTGEIDGNLESSNADIEGRFTGKLKLSDTLTLRSTAYVEGEVVVAKLAVEPGATFNATCVMSSGVKKMDKQVNRTQTNKNERTA